MKQAMYMGPLEHLMGQTALLREKEPVDPSRVIAQFDDLTAARSGVPGAIDYLAFGWHEFDRADFTEFKVRT